MYKVRYGYGYGLTARPGRSGRLRWKDKTILCFYFVLLELETPH